MSKKIKAEPVEESDSEEELIAAEVFVKKAKFANKFDYENSKRHVGGLVINSENDGRDQMASTSLSAAEKKGLKQVQELERELDLKNTFSKETNMRDENAEMNKYIEEQIRLRREKGKKELSKQSKDDDGKHSEFAEMFTMSDQRADKIDDILLQSLSRHIAKAPDEKSEAMLSSQMLNGIPEVDLGMDERIRAIEATEEARLKHGSSSRSSQSYHRRRRY